MPKLTKAQVKALKLVAKRDWDAGVPRKDWIRGPTARVLIERGLIVEVPGTIDQNFYFRRSPIVDLTEAGRAALASSS